MDYRFLFCLSGATHARTMPVPHGAEWLGFSAGAGAGPRRIGTACRVVLAAASGEPMDLAPFQRVLNRDCLLCIHDKSLEN
jgi:hypothetical protein